MLSEISFEDRRYLYLRELSEIGIKNCFTTKCGGMSKGKIEGLNLGFRVFDNKDDVLSNYRLVAEDLGFEFGNMVASKQQHTDNIKIITKTDAGKGVTKTSDISDTDGLVTGEKNIPLVVFSADCFPVLLADKEKKAVAAVHSGWKGTLLDISGKTVEVMKQKFDVRPENIVAAVGAGIGACCFETKEDVASKFDKKYIDRENNGSYYIDLNRMIKDSLLKRGVLEENVFLSKRCTVCENDLFYSYRSHGDKTGRMGAIISL